jgi:hypothetical protein
VVVSAVETVVVVAAVEVVREAVLEVEVASIDPGEVHPTNSTANHELRHNLDRVGYLPIGFRC